MLWPGAISLVALGYYDTSAFLTDSVGPVPIWVFRIAFALIPFEFLTSFDVDSSPGQGAEIRAVISCA